MIRNKCAIYQASHDIPTPAVIFRQTLCIAVGAKLGGATGEHTIPDVLSTVISKM